MGMTLPNVAKPDRTIKDFTIGAGLGGDHMVHIILTYDGKTYDLPVTPGAANKLATLMIQASMQAKGIGVS